jgi:hypothetical protein
MMGVKDADIYLGEIVTKMVIYLPLLNTSQNTPESKYPTG